MKWSFTINLNTILLVAVGIMVFFLLRGCGGKPPGPEYLNTIKAKDDSIKLVVTEMNAFRASKDSAIAELDKADSISKTKFKETVIRYEKIPVYIRSLSKDSLRAAAIR